MAKLYKHVVVSTETVSPGTSGTLPLIEIKPEELPLPIDASQIDAARSLGYIAGKEEAEQQMMDLKECFNATLLSIPKALEEHRKALHTEIADIVLLITQQYFIEREANPSFLENQINQIIAQLNNQHSIELCLHPQDIESLHKGLIQLDTAHLNGITIKSDNSLSLGGCIIKTNHGIFDASIEKQIDKLKDFLLQMKQRGQHVPLE